MILGIAAVALSILLTILAYAGVSFLGNRMQQEMERIDREQQQQQVDQPGSGTGTGTDTSTTP
ncbi:MAG TPA: hypothetical protein VGR35_18635 [Tepidisphaeraceae bacterium]|nr:hypothetical protein [Tepidisphaeraceae bacterium]